MSKKTIYIIAGLIGIIVLAGGAFFTMRLINGSGVQQGSVKNNHMSFGSTGPDGNTSAFSIEIVPSPELPIREPDANGVIESLGDNNFVVKGGNNISIVSSDEGHMDIQSDGPSTEVVITRDTKIFQDVTFDTHEPAAGGKVQQEIKPVEAEEIQLKDIAAIWGNKRGDRLNADVIVINRPVILKQISEN